MKLCRLQLSYKQETLDRLSAEAEALNKSLTMHIASILDNHLNQTDAKKGTQETDNGETTEEL